MRSGWLEVGWLVPRDLIPQYYRKIWHPMKPTAGSSRTHLASPSEFLEIASKQQSKTFTPDQPPHSPSPKRERSFALGRLTTQEIESLRQDKKDSAQHGREYFQKHAPHLAHKS